ncbi:unnamed protein product [Moneuplotes crassus]|uniref:Uncharacterized protein n=1 Tax=Euplotes crassus TaxID=5936 RepID=A0AAD1UN77_EUPCR|nr:unnamed protein product [Moneuplotes crassus]
MHQQTLEIYQDSMQNRLKHAKDCKSTHFMYASNPIGKESVYNPKSVTQDFEGFDKIYYENAKATTVVDLKKNFKRGIQTHWTFHNRQHDGFSQIKPQQKFITRNNDARMKVKELKKDLEKEHFSIGNGESHFNTTNKELMRSSSMPTLGEDSSKNDYKIKKMMSNHHFNFGKYKPDFNSTVNANYKDHETKERAKSVVKNKLDSSVPLSHPFQTGKIKFTAKLKQDFDNEKSKKFYIPTTTRAVKEASNFSLGRKTSLKDNYHTMNSSLSNLPRISHANFISGFAKGDSNREKVQKFRKTNFNIGSPVMGQIPGSTTHDAFKQHPKDQYKIKGMYKQGFKARNIKVSVPMKN